jgi:hypothetical protein
LNWSPRRSQGGSGRRLTYIHYCVYSQ